MNQELGKTWEEVQSEDDRELVEQDDVNEYVSHCFLMLPTSCVVS